MKETVQPVEPSAVDPPEITAAAGTAAASTAAASSADPKVGLRAVVALRRLADVLETVQVDNARAHGWSWQEIADALGVSKQAVHKKHSGRQ